MAPWKRLFIIGISIGAGIVIVLAPAVGGYLWYASRPEPWNRSALIATFDHIDTTEVTNNLRFFYTIVNTTDSDYRLMKGSSPTIMVKLNEQASLLSTTEAVQMTLPLFIPAKHRTSISITMGYSYTRKLKRWANSEERKKYRQGLAAFVNKEMGNLDGFVIFDETNRYEIHLPKGWEMSSEEVEQVESKSSLPSGRTYETPFNDPRFQGYSKADKLRALYAIGNPEWLKQFDPRFAALSYSKQGEYLNLLPGGLTALEPFIVPSDDLWRVLKSGD